jgi:vitamin B12 transporter
VLTYFENRIRDAIVYDFMTGINVNTPGTTTTNGIEAAAEARYLDDRLRVSLSYTWLERALSGQPENIIGLRVHGDITDRIGTGLTATYLDDRSWGAARLASYGVVGLYANFQVTDNVRLTARVENLFDEEYEYFSGFGDTYPGRGRGIFGGAVIDW